MINITFNGTHEDYHAIQGAIEHFAKILTHPHNDNTPIGTRQLTDFDIGYFGNILLKLVKLREGAKRTEDT